jgi:hypothetical protein
MEEYKHKEASCTRKIRDAAEYIANRTGVLICAAFFAPESTSSPIHEPVPLVAIVPEPVLSAPGTNHSHMKPQEIAVTGSESVTATPVHHNSGCDDLTSCGIDLHKETRV